MRSTGTCARSSMADSCRQRISGQDGKQRAHDDQRRADADHVEQKRHDQGADGEPEHEDALERAEDAAEHLVRHGALQQRDARYVHERVPDPEDADEDDRAEDGRPDADQSEPGADQDEPQPEVRGEPPPADQGERDGDADDAADADRGVEEAEARVADVEQVERRDDDQHAQRAGDDRLAEVEEDDDAGVALSPERAEAGDGLPKRVAALRPGRAGRRRAGCAAGRRRSPTRRG